MAIVRRHTKQIRIGDILIGGDAPVSVQSMTKTDTRDITATLSQIRSLADAGCDIIRISVPDQESVNAIGVIRKESPIPVIADCHFDYKLGLGALRQGVDGIRINPGNIGGKDRVAEIVREARSRQIPIRIGVNSGSLEKDIYERFGGPTAEALVVSALRHIELFESENFNLIKISLKSSNVLITIQAYKMIAEKTGYPLHLGVTEAGGPFNGAIKSAVAMGILLSEGIGDTIRVSVTGDPLLEVRAGYEILRSLNLRQGGIEIISCPTCARCQIDLFGLLDRIEKELNIINPAVKGLSLPVKVAIMGCSVNGPGEARDADVGIAGGKGKGVIFKKGNVIRSVKEEHLVEELLFQIREIIHKAKK